MLSVGAQYCFSSLAITTVETVNNTRPTVHKLRGKFGSDDLTVGLSNNQFTFRSALENARADESRGPEIGVLQYASMMLLESFHLLSMLRKLPICSGKMTMTF